METYGKIGGMKKLWLELRGNFKINPHSENAFRKKGLNCYLPKPKKKFYLAVVVSIILISPIIPAGVLGVPFIMKWGLI